MFFEEEAANFKYKTKKRKNNEKENNRKKIRKKIHWNTSKSKNSYNKQRGQAN